MIHIALCDDDSLIAVEIKKYLDSYFMQNDLDYHFQYFASSAELLKAPFIYDVLFLDIMLESNCDGIEVGKKLRKMGNKAIFILITSRNDRTLDGYSATVFRYLIKPVTLERLCATMAEVYKHWTDESETVSFKFHHESYHEKISDIIMFELYNRVMTIYTIHSEYRITITWRELEELLKGKHFYRPQRGFYINLRHVASNNKISVTMKNGKNINFIKGKYPEFNKAFMEYLGDE